MDDVTGRELDVLVAERVFGLLVEPRTNVRTGERDFVHVLTPEGPARQVGACAELREQSRILDPARSGAE